MELLREPAGLALVAAALLLTGVIAGVLAGLLGVGGGIVIVPVLYHLFTQLGLDEAVKMHLAVGTSLATIIPTSMSSARSHWKRGAVDLELLKTWGPPIFLGVLAGSVIAAWVEGQVLTGIFAIIALLVAANMAFRSENTALAASLPAKWLQRLLAIVIGGFSTLMGIGGGTLSVPLLSAFNYPIRRAVGTASAIGLIIALPGTLGFVLAGWSAEALPQLSIGYVNLVGFALIVPATVLAAPWGAKLAHSINPNRLRKAFAFFLLITSLRMFSGLL